MGRPHPSALYYRIAAVLTLLYALGHTLGAPWTPAQGPAEAAVVEQMRAVPFTAEGVTRTYWDFYFGFGWVIAGMLVMVGAALWTLGGLARDHAARLRPVAAVFAVGFAVNAGLEYQFFFAIPMGLAIAIVAALIAAIAVARAPTP